MRKYFKTAIGLFLSVALNAQQKPLPRIHQFADFTATIGSSEGTVAASYVRNWRLGKTRKLEIGLGGRITSYFGTQKEFYTAPARLARSSTIPFVVVFSGHEVQNIDTLTVQSPFTASLNLSANVGYYISSKWYAGVNIDLAGITVGKSSSAILLSNGIKSVESYSKPSGFNLLLTGDNDYGSLNSEFFIKYKIGTRWQLKAVYQFFFAEYKTKNVKQIAPDGTIVNRFRNKVNALGLGLSHDL